MIQNLNNNLITAPELAELRKRLRNLETRVWTSRLSISECQPNRHRMDKHSSLHFSGRGVITPSQHSRCVYLHKHTSKPIISSRSCKWYNTLNVMLVNRISAELEMTVNMLIQIDKLVQLLESPVFTCKHWMN